MLPLAGYYHDPAGKALSSDQESRVYSELMRERNATGRMNRKDATAFQLKEIEDILRRVDAMPLLDTRSEDSILGYGEQAEAIVPEV